MASKLKKSTINSILTHAVLVILGMVFILPFLWMISTSLKPPQDMFVLPPKWIPETIMWSNYEKALTQIPFFRYAGNTLFLTAVKIVGVLVSTSMVAYAFARLKFRGRNLMFGIMLATMMLPAQVTLIPLFVMYNKFHWLDTYLPLTVPSFFAVESAFYIFMLRQFMKGLPNELSESAKIDGCSHFRFFLQIVIPLCKPALATVTIFTFMATWNDFLGPLIFINDRKKITLALGLRAFQQQYTAQWNLMMAASIVSMVPTLAIFFFSQKYFIEGITFTGIKG